MQAARFRKALSLKDQTLPQRVVMRASLRRWNTSGSSNSATPAVSTDTLGFALDRRAWARRSLRSGTAGMRSSARSGSVALTRAVYGER